MKILLLSMLLFLVSCVVSETKGDLKFSENPDEDSSQVDDFDNPNLNSQNGVVLYKNNCMGCHGGLVTSTKLSRSSEQIKMATLSVPAMNSLGFLKDDQVDLIEAALSFKPPVMFNESPKTSFAASTETVMLSINTNEKAQCRYSKDNMIYNLMTFSMNRSSDSLSHSKIIPVESGKSYTYYIHCSDRFNNSSTSSKSVSFSIEDANAPDINPPQLISSNPLIDTILAPNTSSTNIEVVLNEKAACRYSPLSNVDYDQMTLMSITGDLRSIQNISNLANNSSYNFNIKCRDEAGNTASFDLKFKVAPLITDGVQLYSDNCLGCHGPLATSTKINRSFNQIKNAIEQNSTMKAQAFLQILLDSQIQTIADTLKKEIVVPIDGGDLNQSVVLGTRTYITSKLSVLFVNDNPNGEDIKIKSMINEIVNSNQFSDFGGTCTDHDPDCPGASEANQNGAGMLPGATTVRSAYLIRACKAITDNDRAVSNVLLRSDLSLSSVGNIDNITKLFITIAPGAQASDEVLINLKGIYDQAITNNLSQTQAWKFVTYSLCESAIFELY